MGQDQFSADWDLVQKQLLGVLLKQVLRRLPLQWSTATASFFPYWNVQEGSAQTVADLWVQMRSLNSALWKALETTCKYVGKEPSGELNASDDFSGILRSQDPQTIIQAYEAGLITREVAIEELKVRGLITQEIDLVELVRQLEEDQKRSNPDMNVLKGAFGGLKSIQDGQGTPPAQDQAGWNMR